MIEIIDLNLTHTNSCLQALRGGFVTIKFSLSYYNNYGNLFCLCCRVTVLEDQEPFHLCKKSLKLHQGVKSKKKPLQL